MKTIKRLGLTAMLLGATLAPTLTSCNSDNKADNSKGSYIEGSIKGNHYSQSETKNKYQLEGQVLFEGSKRKQREYFMVKNTDQDGGELPFTMTPFEEARIWEAVDTNTGESTLEGQKYVPTELVKKGQSIAAVEITDRRVKAKVTRELRKAKRNGDKKAFGHAFNFNSGSFKKKIPRVEIEGCDYLYFDGEKANYFVRKENSKGVGVLEQVTMYTPEGSLPEVFIPITDNTKGTVDQGKKTLIIANDKGFFRPIIEENQTDAEDCGCFGKKETEQPTQPADSTSVQPTQSEMPQDITDYMRYREEMEKRMLLDAEHERQMDSIKVRKAYLEKMLQQEIDAGLK